MTSGGLKADCVKSFPSFDSRHCSGLGFIRWTTYKMREKWTHRVRESGRVAAGPFALSVACDDDGDDVIRPGRAGRDPPSPLVARRRLPPAARRCLCHCAIIEPAPEPRVQEAALRGDALPRRRRGGRGFDSRPRRGSLASWPGALTGGVPAADGGGDRRRVRAPEAGEGGDRVSLIDCWLRMTRSRM